MVVVDTNLGIVLMNRCGVSEEPIYARADFIPSARRCTITLRSPYTVRDFTLY